MSLTTWVVLFSFNSSAQYLLMNSLENYAQKRSRLQFKENKKLCSSSIQII